MKRHRIPRKLKKRCKRLVILSYLIQEDTKLKSSKLRVLDVIRKEYFWVDISKAM